MKWRLPFVRTESRTERRQASTQYWRGDQIPQAPAAALATMTACESLWSRALSSATVTGTRAEVLTPSILALTGRALITHGEAIWQILVTGEQVRLRRPSYYSVDAPTSGDERLWRYSLSDQAEHCKATSAEVLHFRILENAVTPWRGRSPWTLSRRSVAALAGGTQSLDDEFRIMPRRFIGTDQMLGAEEFGNIQEGLETKVPGALTVFSGGVAPNAVRIGPEMPTSIHETVTVLQDAICGAAGVPPVLLRGDSQAASQREAWRQFLFGSISPVARLIQAEARDKLASPDLEIGFSELRASDLTGRARAFRQLIDGGIPLAEAREICGL